MQDVQPRLPLDAVLRVHELVERTLVRHGFEPDSESAIYSRSRVGELDDWVWLPVDVSPDGASARITANLAIFCEPLADWLRAEHPTSAAHLATLTRNIGYLLPQRRWKEWAVDAAARADEVGHEVASSIETFGLPWLEECESLEDLRDAFQRAGGKDHREISVPRLDLHLAEIGHQTGPLRRKRSRAASSAAAGTSGVAALWICDD
jgi:hypothetical protein